MATRPHLTFAGIQKAILDREQVDLGPLFEWLQERGVFPKNARPSTNVIAGKRRALDHLGKHGWTRSKPCQVCGVWKVIYLCHLSAAAREPEATFIVEYGRALTRARTDLLAVASRLNKATRGYLIARGAHLSLLRNQEGDGWRVAPQNIALPGAQDMVPWSGGLRLVDFYIAGLQETVLRTLHAPAPLVPALVKRGAPKRRLLRELENILKEEGFTQEQISQLLLDRGSAENAPERVHERRRKGSRRSRRPPTSTG